MAAFALLFGLTFAALTRSADPKVEADLRKVDEGVAQGPFRASWDALEHYKVPEWYVDAKFGIFIHWGVYSVPGFDSEWYPRNMYILGSPAFKHHVATYGPQSKFGYKDFIPMFRAEKFDPNAWAELFRKAGAKYVVPVAEHHDGFPMYDCDLTEWSAARVGPKRDVVNELARHLPFLCVRDLEAVGEGVTGFAAGDEVTVEVDGSPRELPAEVDLAAFRIVQEAVTNVARHAGQSRAIIRVAYGEHDLTVQVDDNGRGATPGTISAGGSGIAGMRERTAALGGRLDAGPRPGGGFRVRAQLPVDGVR